MLIVAASGQGLVSRYTVKLARGVTGPYSNLNLPIQERVYPFKELELGERTKIKQKQRRYRKGFENYHGGRFSEGHYWRELRNEPFSWYNRSFDDPYPSRSLLSR